MPALPTLSEYFESHFLSIWIRARSLDSKTESSYRESLKLWKQFTGDPPIDKITQIMVGEFVAALKANRGKKVGATMKASSISKHCRQLGTLLKTVGPPRRDNPMGQRLLRREPPFFKGPKVPKARADKDWTIEEIWSMYRAASAMTAPKIDGVSAPDWWRCLIVVAYYSGLRINELVQIQFDHIHEQVLTVPPEICKNDKGDRHWLPLVALEHIELIRTGDRSQILHVPKYSTQRRTLYDDLHKLQESAGIELNRRWGFHSFRRTHGTIVGNLNAGHQQDLKLAQRSLGHSQLSVTLGHYASCSQEEARLWEAIEKMPLPVPPEMRPQVVEVKRTWTIRGIRQLFTKLFAKLSRHGNQTVVL